MGLETVTYIDDLVATNPVGATDPKSQGDDHIRNIKAALLATFPNITGAVTLTHSQLNEAARLSAANVFTAIQQITASAPRLRLSESGATADEGNWQIYADADEFRLRAYDDAWSVSSTFLTVQRSGTTVDEIQFDATLFDFNGALNLSGILELGGSSGLSRGIVYNNASGAWTLLNVTGGAANSKVWLIGADTSNFRIYTRTDADASGANPLAITRSGTTVTQFWVQATTLLFDGTTLDINALSDFSTFATFHGVASSTRGSLEASSTLPGYRWIETDADTDEGQWMAFVSSGNFQLRAYADDGATGNSPITIARSGITIDEIQFDATLFDLNVTTFDCSGVLLTPNTSASEVGFKGLPTATDETPVLADAGKIILATTNVTVPANGSVAFPVGTVLTVYNNAGAGITIAVTTDTLELAGTTSTGSRSLADNGVATLLKVASTKWVISGVGLS